MGLPSAARLILAGFAKCSAMERGSRRRSLGDIFDNIVFLKTTMKNKTFPELNDSQYVHLAEFRYRLRRFVRFTEENARRVGLEPQQQQLLLALRGLPKDRKPVIRTLAERLQLKHHSTVELINRLEANALVRRVRAKADRREVLVELTLKGRDLLLKLSLENTQELVSSGPELVEALQTLLSELTRSKSARHKSAENRAGEHKSDQPKKSKSSKK